MDYLIIIAIFLVSFPLFWCGVIFLIGRFGGWANLASHYGYSGEHKSNQQSGRSVSLIRLRFFPCNYSFIVRMSTDDQALYLSLMKIFAVGHSSLRVPFRDLSLSRHKTGNVPMGHIHMAKTPDIRMALRKNDLEWIEAQAGELPPRK